MFSSSKGAAYLVVALLVQDGVLKLDQRVSHYWPRFAAEGKGELTLRELLAHRAGVVGADTGFGAEELADEPLVAERLAAQRPFWRPGTALNTTHRALTGEVVRRVTGQSIRSVVLPRVSSCPTILTARCRWH